MRIHRKHSRLTFRKRRRSGCLSLAVFIGVFMGVATVSWNWFGLRFQLAGGPRTPNTNLQTAQAALARGDLDTAIDQARLVLAANADDVDALVLLAWSLLYRSYTDYNHESDRQAALRLIRGAAEQWPDNLDVQAMYAYVLQAVDEPIEAARVAREVLDQRPDDTLARAALALSYGGVGGFDTALRESLEAVNSGHRQGSPWLMDAERALAISYSDLGSYADAVQAAERAIALNDRLLPLYFERALYAMQLGDADAATVAYFKILAYAPDNMKARLRLCELSSLLRESDSAIRYCTEVIQRAPTWADGWYQLGREYFLQGKFRAAQESFNWCSSLQVSQNVPIEDRHFECWYLQGQAAEALGDCESLVTIYNEFRAMAAVADIPQTWTYPPEGPPGCTVESAETP